LVALVSIPIADGYDCRFVGRFDGHIFEFYQPVQERSRVSFRKAAIFGRLYAPYRALPALDGNHGSADVPLIAVAARSQQDIAPELPEVGVLKYVALNLLGVEFEPVSGGGLRGGFH
jgi:hypothetical protein